MLIEDGLKLWEASTQYENDPTPENEQLFLETFHLLEEQEQQRAQKQENVSPNRKSDRRKRINLSLAYAFSVILLIFLASIGLIFNTYTTLTNQATVVAAQTSVMAQTQVVALVQTQVQVQVATQTQALVLAQTQAQVQMLVATQTQAQVQTPVATQTQASQIYPVCLPGDACAPFASVPQFQPCSQGMVFVEQGTFLMGDGDAPIGANDYPLRSIFMDAFCIDRTEISNEQYLSFLSNTNYSPPMNWPDNPRTDEFLDLPVVNVDWFSASAYCHYHGEMFHIEANLPTEAQWEKAARGNYGRTYPWGEDPPSSLLANFAQANVEPKVNTVESYFPGESPYGVLNMAGNVSEWVRDWYAPDWYKTMRDKNPFNFSVSPFGTKAIRGGSFSDSALSLQSTSRNGNYHPNEYSPVIGFRCAANFIHD